MSAIAACNNQGNDIQVEEEDKDVQNGDASTRKNSGIRMSVQKKLAALTFRRHNEVVPDHLQKQKTKSWWSKLKLRVQQNENSNSDLSIPFVRDSSTTCVGYNDIGKQDTYTNVCEGSTAFEGKNTPDGIISTVSSRPVSLTSASELAANSADECGKFLGRKLLKKLGQNFNCPAYLYPSYVFVVPSSEMINYFAMTSFRSSFRGLQKRKISDCSSSANLRIESSKHHLVSDLLNISNSGFYWGKLCRYEAEKALDTRRNGTFLVRDSCQNGCLFTVSMRNANRTVHTRIEQHGTKFSFDANNPQAFASDTVCGLIKHYEHDHSRFQPNLTHPLQRPFIFPLQHLCRAVICNSTTYDGIDTLSIPGKLNTYLKEYSYKCRNKNDIV